MTKFDDPADAFDNYIADSTADIGHEILAGRIKAHTKHGDNSIEAIHYDDPKWLAILMEEVGEMAHEFTYDAHGGDLRKEMIDVATVIVAWIASYDREP